MEHPNFTSPSQVRVKSIDQIQIFVRSVYNWMAIGLALTGIVAYFVNQTPALNTIARSGFIVFAIAEIALVFWLSARIGKMSASKATGLFIAYATLNGVTFSIIFELYAHATIASTFFICALMFGALSIFGWTTKKDLTGLGNFMMMGFFGILIATVVNIFLQNPMVHMIISYIGVLVFAGLTAYDTQAIKQMAASQPADISAGVVRKGAIMGALKLYLDFILMFQFLLSIMGGSRD